MSKVVWQDEKNTGRHKIVTICYDEALSGPGIGERPGAPQGGIAELTGDMPEFVKKLGSADRKCLDAYLRARDARRAKDWRASRDADPDPDEEETELDPDGEVEGTRPVEATG